MLISLSVGEEQPLQILDAEGNELSASNWSVDSPELAEIKEVDGHPFLRSKAAGVVHVMAMHEGRTLTEEVKILYLATGMYLTGLRWVVPSTGRELGVLQSVPVQDAPDIYTLDQSDKGASIRALTNRGQQLWIWTLPKPDGKLEALCGENLGGAVFAVTRRDSYSLYVVGKDGKLRWRHKFDGVRKGYAVNAENTLHLVNESVDGSSATISGWDASTGVEKFKLTIPASYEGEVNLERSGDRILCAPGRTIDHPLHAATSGIFVNTNGDAYLAFNQKRWILKTDKCVAGSVVDPQTVYFSRDDRLVVWRIQPEGSHREFLVDESRQPHLPLAAPVTITSPTGDIIPDGFGGILFSIRWSSTHATQPAEDAPREFVYRVTEEGELAYRFSLPGYSGTLHDEMVLGEQELGFATRGSQLVAFKVREGNEVWRWNSGEPGLQINMATAGGGCIVETTEGLVLIEEGVKKQLMAPPHSDIYGPGLFLQNDPHGLAMFGAGIRHE